MTNAVHQDGGSKVIVQLNHCGRQDGGASMRKSALAAAVSVHREEGRDYG